MGMAQRLNERRHSSCELFPAWGGRTDRAEASRKPPAGSAGPPGKGRNQPHTCKPQPARARSNPTIYSLFLVFYLMKQEF